MKLVTLMLFLIVSPIVLAKTTMIFPSVFTFPNNVQVQIFNNTQNDVWCTGSLFIRKMSGATQTEFYSERVYRGMNSYRSFYNRTINDRFINTTHTIHCN